MPQRERDLTQLPDSGFEQSCFYRDENKILVVALHGLHYFHFPPSQPEQEYRDDCQQYFRGQDGEEDSVGAKLQAAAQKKRQRKLQDPIARQVDKRGCKSIASAVEGLYDHHAVSKQDIAHADDAQAACTNGDDLGIVAENSD